MIKAKLYIILILCLKINIYSQDFQTLEFNDKPVIDVLMVLGDLSGKNIVVDKTVSGNCSYYFTTENLDEALNIFLISQKLYITEINKAFFVSRIKGSINENKKIDIFCADVDIKIVIDSLIKISGITILYDNLPRESVNLNIKELELNEILEILIKKYPDFTVEENSNYLYIKKIQSIIETTSSIAASTNGITINNDNYSISINKSRFTQIINEFFVKSGYEYSIQGRNDTIIDRLEHHNKTFYEMLDIIVEAGSCDYILSNNIYYIFDINKNEIANRHQDTQIIKLKNLNVNDLVKLIPGSYLSTNSLKIDESTNSVIVYGTKIKTEPIIEFIKLVDTETDKKPRWIKLNYISGELLKNTIKNRYSQSSIINVDSKSFIILLNDVEYSDVLNIQKEIDIPTESHQITLKYIKSEDLLKNLPQFVNKDEFVESPNPSVIFFYGDEEKYKKLLLELNKIDKPVPQIKYKILVLQNNLGDNLNFELNTKSHSSGNGDITLPDGEWTAFSGALGSLLGLNFNVISAFGPLFSFELNASIKNNQSKVLVDTTLQALSGKKVSFRNTTTSRFYQTTVNADGKTEKTGSTQEVSWGIILDIEGWTSGDGMITVKVQSTLSDETKVSGDSSGIPSTSEKIVNTEVRTREGEPVIIGGLLSNKIEKTREKTPILGDIPLLGYLFTKTIDRETQSEFTIYLLPYIENNLEDNVDLKIKRAYKEFIN